MVRVNSTNTISSTDVHDNWSAVIDTVIQGNPFFFHLNNTDMILADVKLILSFLDCYNFNAEMFIEVDGSVTLSSCELDLVVNEKDEKTAMYALANEILEYAKNFYKDFLEWSAAPNRKQHILMLSKH